MSAGSAAHPKSCCMIPVNSPDRRTRSTANRPTPIKAISAIVSLLFAKNCRQGAGFGAGFFLGCGLVDLGDPCLLMDSREVSLAGCTTAAPFQRLSWLWNGAAARLASASESTPEHVRVLPRLQRSDSVIGHGVVGRQRRCLTHSTHLTQTQCDTAVFGIDSQDFGVYALIFSYHVARM